MSTLILSPRFTQDSIILAQAAAKNHWNVRRLDNHWQVGELAKDEAVAIFGEPLFVQYAAEQLSLVPIETPEEWLSALPFQYTHRVMKTKTIGELTDSDFPAFIKTPNDKSFKAVVFSSIAGFAARDYLPSETILLLSEPVFWEVEFRCFVHQRKCVTCSLYARDGGVVALDENGAWIVMPAEQAEAQRFLDGFLADCSVDIPQSIVIDVGFITGRGWSVIEANGVWSAGIYGCDPDKVLSLLADGFEEYSRNGSSLV
jgi:hypothetical protein